MRIVGGELRGRIISPKMKSWPTRPTTDVSKEALFNILTNRIDFQEVAMLDLFGGTGNHSWEFLSRGCKDVTYVDNYKLCVDFVKNQSIIFGYQSELKIFRSDVRKFIGKTHMSFDYIFAGPPYGMDWLDLIPDIIFTGNLLKQDGLMVLEHNPNHDFVGHDHFVEIRKYGQTLFSFFM